MPGTPRSDAELLSALHERFERLRRKARDAHADVWSFRQSDLVVIGYERLALQIHRELAARGFGEGG